MRKLLPRPNQHPQQEHDQLPTPILQRRPRDKVNIACNACRKRKSKCDRRRPRCLQCTRNHTACHFSPPMMSAFYELPGGGLYRLLNMIREASSDERTQILDTICQAPSAHAFAESFHKTRQLPTSLQMAPFASISEMSSRSSISFNQRLLPSIEPFTVSAELVKRFPHGILPIAQWTPLSVDNKYLTHLLNLFFTWDSALSHTIHQTAFLEGVKAPDALKTHHVCSTFLVHCLLALSHLFLMQGVSQSQLKERLSRSREFADEALRILDQQPPYHSIPLAQGLALLWTYEVNYGQEEVAHTLLDQFYVVHKALITEYKASSTSVDQFRFPPTPERDSTAFALWGFFCLEVKLSLIYSRPMRLSRPCMPGPFSSFGSSTATAAGATENVWQPYPYTHRTQFSHFKERCIYEYQLAELAWEASSLLMLSNDNLIDAHHQATKVMYSKVMAWNTGSAQALLLNKSQLPSVLFLDVTFQIIQVKLLTRLAQLTSSESGRQTITSTRASHGETIISSLSVYRALYGVRHEYWLAHTCYTATTAMLNDGGANHGQSKSITIACELLLTIGIYLPVANRFLWNVKALALQLQIALPETCTEIFSILAARDRTTRLTNVNVVNLGHGSIGAVGPLEVPVTITFSGLIQSFQPNEGA
ncbi:fungal zn(2)-Cys(6) binuclear cluster domain-containing protein [Sarocladium implicatum]|nr:fungal zn(2)-Cys(6) binuclear cluster domain-containing protein [Sarocladium implicatum]